MPGLLNNEQRLSPKELYERNRDGALNVLAIEKGMNLSTFLEEEDPSTEYGENEVLDAFGRQLKVAGIKTYSNPAAGIWADDFGKFDREGNRGLAIEFLARRWREARYGVPANTRAPVMERNIMNRSVFTSVDEALNTIFRPYSDAMSPRAPRRALQVTLDRLVTLTTPIDSDAYRAAYMSEPAAEDIRMTRVPELGEIPLATITQGAQTIRLHKYGRGFELSYEAVRRTKIDKVAFWVQRTAIQQEVDKVAQAIDVLTNGDGNGNAATVHNQTVLHPSSPAGTMTFEAWLQFKESFGDAYVMDLALMRSASKVELLMLNTGNAYNMAYTIAQMGGVNDVNGRLGDVVDVASYSGIAADIIVGIDTSAALEHVMEIGSSITETAKFVTRQSDVMVMSEVEGFAVLDENATHVYNVNA
jgi:hypothetical protein